ncbi:MAG: hypothetical protein IPH03_08485 [Tetrasphaera sp.]|nr:hypothetical protein [Tetrasphaera sp.]
MLAENVADAVGTIAPLFDDPDPDIHAAAPGCATSPAAPQAVDSLIETFLDSASFVDRMEHLFDALEGLERDCRHRPSKPAGEQWGQPETTSVTSRQPGQG